MTCVAIAKMTCWEVENADEQGDEDVGFVVAAGSFVESLHDLCGIVFA